MNPYDRTKSHHPDVDPIDAAAEEFVSRFRNGERPKLEEYTVRHPELADDIRKLFPMLVALEECGSTVDGAAAVAVSRSPGERVGGFTLVRRIGEGGMGVVYEAVQESLGRSVAVKFLKGVGSGATARERFAREIQAVARLDHPNVVPVYGSDEHAGLPYYAMRLIRGHGLDTVIDEQKVAGPPLAAAVCRAIELVRQVADALAYAHRQGVIHRDIKPSNLLVDDTDRVWVADFGLAHIDGGATLTATGGVVGTRQYMAPEQYSGWADPRSDVYALGVTLYELTTGSPAFDGQTPQEVLRQVTHGEVMAPRRRNPHLSRDLETVILKAMASEPAHRYQTSAALADDLRRLLEGRPVTARRLSGAVRAVRWARRNPTAAGLVAAVVLLMTAVTVLSAWAALRFNHLRHDAVAARGTIEKQRDTIGRQLDEKEKAESEANSLLARSLLRTAQAEMAGRDGGKREALAVLTEAANLDRRLNHPADYRQNLRREYVAALALSDVVAVPDRTWDVAGLAPHTPLSFSACGRWIAVADKPGGISLRTADGGKEVRTLIGPPGEKIPRDVTTVRFSPSGTLLAGRVGKAVRVWNTTDGRLLGEYGPTVESTEGFDLLPDDSGIAWVEADRIRVRKFGHNVDVQFASLPVQATLVRCDPTGRRLAFASPWDASTYLLDLETGRNVRLPLPKGVDRLTWAPDGEGFAAAGEAYEVYVVSVRSPANPLILRGHDSRVVRMAFHPHEDVLVTCGWDQTVQVWDLTRPAKPVHVRHSMSYRDLSFTADGRWLGPGVTDNRLWVWEWVPPTAGRVVVRSRLGALNGAALRPDGTTLVGVGDGGLEVWEVTRPRRPLASYPNYPRTPEDVIQLRAFGLKWQPDDGDPQMLIDRKWFKPLPALYGRRVRFSPDGRELTVAALGGLSTLTVRDESPGSFRLTDRVTRREFGGYESAQSDDGSRVAVLPERGPLDVYDNSGQKLASFDRPGGTGVPVISPDKRWLASGAWPEKVARVWDLQTKELVKEFTTSSACAVIFSPDNKWLVIGSGAEYQFFRTGDWKIAHHIPRTDCGHLLGSAAFTPDSKTLAVWTRPGRIALIDPETGREYTTLPVMARTGSLATNGELKFTPDGRFLTVVAQQKQIQVWDIIDLRKQLAAVGLDWHPAE